MRILQERCAGLDVHKKTVVACVRIPEGQETRTFGTMTEDLRKLNQWLLEKGCTHVAMESTGVYWKPIYNLLEETDLDVWVVNAYHMKNLPGRKTDVNDAEWIADLLRHGLLEGRFIPERTQRELRELTRYRRALIQECSREINRLQKVLEGANIKLSSVASDVMGASGRAMLEAITEGLDDPDQLATFAQGRLKEKRTELTRALDGLVGEPQRFLLREQLQHIEDLESRILRLSEEVAKRMAPCKNQLAALDTIPGVGPIVAEELVAEIGTDMKQFPTDKPLASWAKLSPGNNESAGKRKSGKTGKGNRWIRSALVTAAHAAGRKRDSYLSSKFHRIAARRGKKRAAIAVAHTIFITARHLLLQENAVYEEKGVTFFDRRNKEAIVKRAAKRLEQLGYKVEITPFEKAA